MFTRKSWKTEKLYFAMFLIWVIVVGVLKYNHALDSHLPLYHNLCLSIDFCIPSGEFTWRGQDCQKLVQKKKEYRRQQKDRDCGTEEKRIVWKALHLCKWNIQLRNKRYNMYPSFPWWQAITKTKATERRDLCVTRTQIYSLSLSALLLNLAFISCCPIFLCSYCEFEIKKYKMAFHVKLHVSRREISRWSHRVQYGPKDCPLINLGSNMKLSTPDYLFT